VEYVEGNEDREVCRCGIPLGYLVECFGMDVRRRQTVFELSWKFPLQVPIA